MNDPHVVKLLYRIDHSTFFRYENVKPCKYEQPKFWVTIEGDQATVEPKGHFATAEELREIVERFLRVWELDADLRSPYYPEPIRFVYRDSCIVDRKRNPNTIVSMLPAVQQEVVATVFMRCDQYPVPPAGLAIGFEVDAMFDRWSRYRSGQALLGGTADFCRAALERGVGRQAAADRYGISRLVLDKLGELADQKGGSHARKYKGYGIPYTEGERTWLEAALRKVIRRAAEVADDPDATRQCITMDDLPTLD